jgi:hypothetical protein
VVRIRLTEEEKELIIRELSERIKDLVFMSAYYHTKQALRKIFDQIQDRDVDPNQLFTVNFHYSFVLNDLLQIVGRHRRSRPEGKGGD